MKARIGIPIQLTAVVPIDVDIEDAEFQEVDRVDEWLIADGSEHQKIIADTLAIACEDAGYQEALESFVLIGREVALKHGKIRVYFTPCAGVKPESNING